MKTRTRTYSDTHMYSLALIRWPLIIFLAKWVSAQVRRPSVSPTIPDKAQPELVGNLNTHEEIAENGTKAAMDYRLIWHYLLLSELYIY